MTAKPLTLALALLATPALADSDVSEARQRAESRLAEKLDDEEIASVNAALAHSLAQLNVKRRQRR